MLRSLLHLLRVIGVVLWAGVTAIWVIVAAVITFIAQMFIPSTEERLRKLNKPE